jgi:Spy/CpxP family protein refolding chaperone
MTKTKVILLVSVVLAFAAGTALGMFIIGSGRSSTQPSSVLSRKLNLTADQQDRMRKIWSEAMGSVSRQHAERRAALAQERDQAIQALLSGDQRTRYEAIQQNYTRQAEQLSQERKRAFEDAVRRTKEEILTPDQAVKYDELMKGQREHGMSGGPFRPWRRHSTSSASRPTTDERPTSRGGE